MADSPSRQSERVRVVLWADRYKNDALERMAILGSYDRAFRWRDVRLEGSAGDWRVTAELELAS
jgi:hypothetical protein